MSNIEEKDAGETMVEMAEIAAQDRYRGAWYPLELKAEVGALCMEHAETCERRGVPR